MVSAIALKGRSFLPKRAIKLAEILRGYEEGATKEEVKQDIKSVRCLDTENIDEAIRMLVMTDNIEINQKKAYLIEHDFECKGLRRNPFRQWERNAIKENSGTLEGLKKEKEVE